MFSALAKNGQFMNTYVPVFVALGPVLKLTNTKSKLIKRLAKFYNTSH